MSGATIGGVVGGVIGFFVGAPQLGFAIGSMVGAALDPQILQGPRLGDIPVQTSQEGVFRPIIYGAPQPFPGNIIMTGPKVFSVKRERQGKGGPIIESEQVHQTYAIRICEGPAVVLGIIRDGKLVYDRTGTQPLDADSASFASKVVLYEGNETQLPDGSLEGLPSANGGGVGNVPAHRGTAYMVVVHDDLTPTGGRIPNYEFLMASSATIAPGQSRNFWFALTKDALDVGQTMGGSPNATQWTSVVSQGSDEGIHLTYGNGILLRYGADGTYSLDQGETWSSVVTAMDSPVPGAYLARKFWIIPSELKSSPDGQTWTVNDPTVTGAKSCIGGTDSLIVVGTNTGHINRSTDGGDSWVGAVSVTGGPGLSCVSKGAGQPVIVVGTSNTGALYWSSDGGATWTQSTSPFASGNAVFAIHYGGGTYVACCEDGKTAYSTNGTTWFESATTGLNGRSIDYNPDEDLFVMVGRVPAGANVIATSSDGNTWTIQTHSFSTQTLNSVVYMPCVGFELPDAPGYYVNYYDGSICGPAIDVATPGTVYLSDIELDIADRVGLESSQFDVSEITAIEVRGFLIGKQMSASAALTPLATAYFHDLPEYDLQIHARRRGDVSVISLVDTDFVDTGEDEDIRAQAIELPRKLNLYFSDPDANHAVVPVPAERTSINVKATGIASIEVPIVLDRDEAKQKAEIMLKVIYEESQDRLIRELPAFKHADLVASDPITFDNKRWRINTLEQHEATIKIEAMRDRISNYTSGATAGVVVNPTDPISSVKGPTLLAVMNLPSLRTSDTEPGVYAVVQGFMDGWPGADIYVSVDGGVTEQLVTTIFSASVMGEMATDCDADGADSNGLLNVRIYYGGILETITDEQMATRQNGFAIITDDVAEVGQFQTATEDLVTDLLYEVTDVLRGQLGTTAASHQQGDRFVILDNATFIPIDEVHAGQTLIFRAVTRGTPVANNTTVSLVFDPPTFIIDGGSA